MRFSLLRPRAAAAAYVAAAFVFVAASPPALAADALTAAQRDAVKAVVRDLIKAEPELIYQALTELERRQEAAESQRAAKALVDLRSQLERDPADVVIGPADADATIVEFFDYRCTYCKLVDDRVKAVLDGDKKLRLVFKQLPVLGPQSIAAARIAVAVQRQGQTPFLALHKALMAHRGPWEEPALRKLAQEAGADLAKMDEALKDPALDAPLRRTMELAKALGINGTPAFVIGDKLIPGAVDADALKAAVAEARKARRG